MIYKSLKNVIGIKIKVIKDGTGPSIKKNLYFLPMVERIFLRIIKARRSYEKLNWKKYKHSKKRGWKYKILKKITLGKKKFLNKTFIFTKIKNLHICQYYFING